MRSHYGQRGPLLKCPYTNCESWLRDEDCLKSHIRGHNPDGEIVKCPDCGKICPHRKALSAHKAYHHSNKIFKCEYCDKTFKKPISLKEHMTLHTGEVLYNCPFCTKRFNSNATMYAHKKKQHPIEWAEAKRQKLIGGAAVSAHDEIDTNVCSVCNEEIKDKKAFEIHIRSHYGDRGPHLKCPFNNCNSSLKDKDSLKIHIERHHNEDETIKCPDCDKMCRNRNALSAHRYYVHSKEIFQCEYCAKIFKRATTLKEHMSQHTGKALYECPFCTRKFNSNGNMHTHKKKHHPKEWAETRKRKLS